MNLAIKHTLPEEIPSETEVKLIFENGRATARIDTKGTVVEKSLHQNKLDRIVKEEINDNKEDTKTGSGSLKERVKEKVKGI